MQLSSAHPSKTILVAGALLALATLSLSAQVVTDAEGRRYHVRTDGSLELTFLANDSTNASLYKGHLEVPASIADDDAALVTGISQFACVYCDSLTSVTVDEGVERIGFGAFSDCPALTQVELPTSLTEMGDWAFYRDSSLTALSVPGSVHRVGACSMGFCTSLTQLILQRGIRAIGSHAFYYCPSLREVVLTGNIGQIGEYAFAYCTGLEQVMCEGAPVYVTPDVFEGVDVATVSLVVPSDQVEAYREADVWCDFLIVDGGYEAMPEVPGDELKEQGFELRVEGTTLVLTVLGDAPALVYDVLGRRLAVCASRSGIHRIPLAHAQYIIRCGRETRKVTL